MRPEHLGWPAAKDNLQINPFRQISTNHSWVMASSLSLSLNALQIHNHHVEAFEFVFLCILTHHEGFESLVLNVLLEI